MAGIGGDIDIVSRVLSWLGGIFVPLLGALLGMIWKQARKEQSENREKIERLQDRINNHATRSDMAEIKTLIRASATEAKDAHESLRSFVSNKIAEVHQKVEHNTQILDSKIDKLNGRLFDVVKSSHGKGDD